MKDGKCPKCNSNNVYRREKGIDWGSESQWIEIWTGEPGGSPAHEWAGFDSYVCVDCGYFETYILKQTALDEIRAKWAKVS